MGKLLKIERRGDDNAVILSSEDMTELHLQLGDSVLVQRSPSLTSQADQISDEEFERQMSVARTVMKKYERALRELAK